MPDPTWADADPAFRALVEECEKAASLVVPDIISGPFIDAARLALHTWHREEVAKAVREALEVLREKARTSSEFQGDTYVVCWDDFHAALSPKGAPDASA